MLKPRTYYRSDIIFFVYPTKEKVRRGRAGLTSRRNKGEAKSSISHWSSKLRCDVRHTSPGDIFFVIKQEGISYFCIFPDFVGWICYENWMEADLAELNE